MIGTQPALRTQIELKPVPPQLLPQVIRLHRALFAPEQVACTIYSGRGVARYLASLIAFPRLQREHVLWGAWDGGKLVGYAHFRALTDSWHLNNIAVLPAYQGQGIGSLFWNRFIDTAHHRLFRQVTLDVESDNQPTIDWYRRRGLDITGAVWRYEKALEQSEPPTGERNFLHLAGWDQAEAWQSAYGFSQFQVHCEGEAWTIGRIGEQYFKVGRRLPAAVEGALGQIDPARRLLVLSKEPLHVPDLKRIGKSLRMSGTLA